MSRIASLAVLVVGIVFGLLTTRITDVMMWIVGALYGGYVMANVLKWYLVAIQRLRLFLGHDGRHRQRDVRARAGERASCGTFGHDINPLYLFPVIFGISVVGCLLGTLLTQAGRRRDSDEILQNRAAVGILGADPRQGDAGRPFVPAESGFLPRYDECGGRHRLAVVPHGLADLSGAAKLALGRRRSPPFWPSAPIFLKFNWFDKLEKA